MILHFVVLKIKIIFQVEKFLNKNNFDKFNDVILTCDRAYFSYAFFNSLESRGFKYVIRIKKCCILLREYVKDDNLSDIINKKNELAFNNRKNKLLNKFTNKNVRFISYKEDVIFEKKIGDKIIKFSSPIECYLITNIDNTDNDDKIKEIYKSRWDIEVFFKLVKTNFKFSHLKEHINNKKNNTNKNIISQYEKIYKCSMIIIYIENIFTKIYNKYYNKNIKKKSKKKKKKNKHEYNYKHNQSLFITGIQKYISYIIKGKLTFDLLIILCKNYVEKTNTIKERSNPRVSIIPFTKWYIKGYINYNNMIIVLTCIINKTPNLLNKNLKLIYNRINVVSITKVNS